MQYVLICMYVCFTIVLISYACEASSSSLNNAHLLVDDISDIFLKMKDAINQEVYKGDHNVPIVRIKSN